MTELYIIRHGLAGDHGSYPNDDERPLTDEGHRRTHKIAKRLRELDLQFDLILTSPLTRARQTADILQDRGLSDRLEESAELAPGGDFDKWLTWLDHWQHTKKNQLAIVGHEPNLSEWAERLIWGEPKHQIILKKAGVIGLTLPSEGSPVGRSCLFWLTPPKFLL
ncbi:MAG: phosphohistidine phosphatase SixA [Oculatellaceae cyanobacterium bins.114]|nr:phosphohistidine phosphatase SixA [Oculatellaceae cyanobacterium bins.114]